MTALAPASTSILTVPSPRPEAPPVTMNVLPLSCMASTSTFLRRLFLFRHQPRPIAQQGVQAVLCDQISPALELFLALRLLEELLAAFLELLVVLRLVFGFLALRGRARLARFAGDAEADVGIAAQREVTAHRLGLSPRKRGDRRALHDFLSEKQPPERPSLGVFQLDRRPGTLRPVLRLEELQASALAIGQGLALHDLQFGELHQERRDTIRVGREPGALAHAPAGLSAGEMQLARGIPDRDFGDLGEAQARHRLLPGARIGARPGRALGEDDGGAPRREDRQRGEPDKETPAVHKGGGLRRRRTASAMPASATRIGINAMFATLVQNWSASLSARSSRRTSFSTRRVSAAFLRKFSSSLCCSAVRIAPAPCPLPFCSAFNFSCVWPRLSSSSLILPR